MLGFHGGDKLLHLFTYAIMMLWFGLIYLPGRTYGNLGIILIIMGIALELAQGMTDHRSLSFLDMVANAVGVSFGWVLAKTRLSSALTHVESILKSRI
jgi:VanZ family protein